MTSPNQVALLSVARKLGALADELVFVGGRVAELLVTDPAAVRVRPTDDSDAVCEVTGRLGYHRLGERLIAQGFREDPSEGAPICRWRSGDDVLDVMPADGSVLGFRNAWYGHALRMAIPYELEGGCTIRIAPAPVFLATKWDAFRDRGMDDWYGSHDVEDIVTVVAGRPELLEELQRTESDVRDFLKSEAARFLSTGLVEDVIAGALPDARIVPGLVHLVRDRFLKIRDMQ